MYIEQTKPSAVIGASWTQFKVFPWLVEQKFRALSSLASFITTKGFAARPKVAAKSDPDADADPV